MFELNLDLSSLGKKRPDPAVVYDLLVLGGGPAAMTAVVYAARKVLNVAILTKELGGQMTGTSEIENYMGFQTITGKELTQRFSEQVEKFDVPILLQEKVRKVTKEGDIFKTELETGASFTSRAVVVATGKRSRTLNVPGEKELSGRGVAYCATCDAPFFKDREVVVAGGGNSAFTAALDLLKVARKVTLVNFTEGWQADGILQEAVRRSGTARLLDNSEIVRIEGNEKVEHVVVRSRATSQSERVSAHGLFVEIGLIPNTDLVEGLAALNPSKELMVDCHCRTNVEGLFGAGDVTTVPYKQIVISAGEGAKAALSACDYLRSKGWI